jgi:multidrug efflux pump
MGGIVGRLFREFAVTLSVAVLVSLVVSLTATPMMCARLLRKRDARDRGRFDRASEHVFNTMLDGYRKSLSWALAHRRFMVLLLLATVCLNAYLYVIVPKGFFPRQDTGRLTGRIEADQSISFQAMRQKLFKLAEIAGRDPAVASVTGVTGGGQRNRGSLYVSLKPLQERDASSEQVIARLREKLAHEPGAGVTFTSAQDIRVGARESGAQYQFTLQADDFETLRTWGPRVRQALGRLPELVDVNSDQQDKGLQTSLVIDRDAAARLGVTASMIDATLNNAFGQRQVSVIYNPLNQYRVVMEAAPEHWQSPEALNEVHVILPSGAQVPLSAFSRYEMTHTPLLVNHQGAFAASTISFNLPAGVSLPEAMQAVSTELQRLRVPSTVQGSFQGTARVFEASLKTQPWLVLAALLAVYIVLGILYESYVHPITILSTLPSAGVGAILALLVCRTEFTLIALIGVILLIGIVKKNAIMMIDVALDAERTQGKSAEAAITYACLLRFRPIMMTTMAALLSAIPLALGGGEGAELRRPLGIAIVGGLIVSQALTLYTTPVVYLYLDRFRLWSRRLHASRAGGHWAEPGGGAA